MTNTNIFAKDFVELVGKGRLYELEQAWQYYQELNALERSIVRDHQSTNGEVDFLKFVTCLEKLHGNGTADLTGKLMLINSLNEELSSLSKEERIRYLNGQPLKFEI